MKPAEQRPNETVHQQTEAIVAQRVHELFTRLPMLSGFWLGPDGELADLAVSTWPDYTAGPATYDVVMQSLADLAEERPEALELMSGRTFARAVH